MAIICTKYTIFYARISNICICSTASKLTTITSGVCGACTCVVHVRMWWYPPAPRNIYIPTNSDALSLSPAQLIINSHLNEVIFLKIKYNGCYSDITPQYFDEDLVVSDVCSTIIPKRIPLQYDTLIISSNDTWGEGGSIDINLAMNLPATVSLVVLILATWIVATTYCIM